MTLLINQFSQVPIQGQVDSSHDAGTLACQVYASESSALIPGQAVKMVDSGNGIPIVTAVTADSDEVFGFVNHNFKKDSYDALDMVEISLVNGLNVMWMTASAAIARNAVVTVVVSGSKVKTSTGGSRDCGRALDKASASGDLIRVMLFPKTTTTS